MATTTTPEPPYQLEDDGGRSKPGSYTGRPITAHVMENVYIANFKGAKQALKEWPTSSSGGICVLNLSCEEKIDTAADNTISIEDSKNITLQEAIEFILKASYRIETLSKKEAASSSSSSSSPSWVVANCQAGCNRSSAAIIGWLILYRKVRKFNEAKQILINNKKQQAIRLRFKNRYQSYKVGSPTQHEFSWPTLSGRSAKILEKALKHIVKMKITGKQVLPTSINK